MLVVAVRAGFTDKKQTQRLANECEERARRIREGLTDPAEERLREQQNRDITEHLAEYRLVVGNRSSDERHVRTTIGYIEMLIEDLGWSRIAHIDAAQTEQRLSELRDERGWSPRTFNA